MSFTHPSLLVVALALVACCGSVAVWRRIAMPGAARGLVGVGLVAVALAAGGAGWVRRPAGRVAVMVDLSPSTRGAGYRDRATLMRRVGQLLGQTHYRVIVFSQTDRASSLEAPLAEMPAERTVFAPPGDVAAVVVFSDGRFEPPAWAPPTYPVVDPALDEARDAAVTRVEVRDGLVAVTARNGSETARQLVVSGPPPLPTTRQVGAGTHVFSERLGEVRPARMMAQLSPGDLWPENDALSVAVPPPDSAERWWVSGSGASADGWRGWRPRELPLDGLAYLGPVVIVLENVPGDALSRAQQQFLQQYVRDLGGSLLILGGDRAFAAGGYAGTLLEDLSPLSSSPPSPAMRWVLLADGSGSMSAKAGATTRWQLAASAVAGLLPHLPPEDLVSIGSFAQRPAWHLRDAVVREAMAAPAPQVTPQGPTNLEPALRQVAREADDSMPTQLVVLTDAETRIDDQAALAALLREKRIRLHILAIGEGSGLAALRELAEMTGGGLLTERDPTRWAEAIRELMRPAIPQWLHTTSVRFAIPDLLPPRDVSPWNRVWLKPTASALDWAEDGAERAPLAAQWQVGNGQVMAAAFGLDAPGAESLAQAIARPPRDPRFRVEWKAGSRLGVTVGASDEQGYLNGRPIRLRLTESGPGRSTWHDVPQVGPGRYELSLPAPRSPVFATVHDGTRSIGQTAIAGRYAEEFDGIGNDRPAMRSLTERTGGRMIEPDDTEAIDFGWPGRSVPLAPWLATIGAALIAAGLVRWRVG